ncbi:unnamed protein product [marine sediment metagenome]|uniref:DUF86 domain-containing protein n=1 Tax=marine sediment metagenome TaxID=412755 RepID=X0TXM8_9ZZZZ
MDELRLKRYRDKINYIVDNIDDLPKKPKNKFEKRGILYSIQTSIESMIDLIAMLIKDLGIPVKSDELNISTIVTERNLNAELGEKLKKANGMRNLLVHRYNEVDEQIILESVDEIKNLLFEWLKIIEGALDEITKD